MSDDRFKLEAAIAAWRRRYEVDDTFTSDDVEELERHVRDQTAALVERGCEEGDAFRAAIRKLGDFEVSERAYRSVFWRKAAARKGILDHVGARLGMLENYLLIAWRSVRRHPGYAAINLAGLAVGLAACLLIGLFVIDELSYDRFHTNADRLYRVVDVNEGDLNTPSVLAPTIEREIADVERAVRFSRRWAEVLIRHEGDVYYENRFYFADPGAFEVFTFPLLRGDPATALERPFTVVITHTTAEKYFGETNPIGRTINVEGPWGAHDFEVAAVADDVPATAHFQWDLLASFSTRRLADLHPEHLEWWTRSGDHTYVLLRKGTMPKPVAEAIRRVDITHRDRPAEIEEQIAYALQPITDIHLGPEYRHAYAPTNDPRYLWIFTAAALLILAIACINYTNLATARASQRAREVGVRKVAGARRGQLVGQFVAESYVLVLLAVAPALVLTSVLLPFFNQLTGKAMHFGQAPTLLAGLLVVVVVVGATAGWYPAFFLAHFRPVTVLKGRLLGRPKGAWIRSGLVAFQFAAAISLIVSTLVVQQQLDFVSRQRLGLDSEHVVVIRARDALDGGRFESFQDAVTRHTSVVRVAGASEPLPIPFGKIFEPWPEGTEYEDRPRSVYHLSIGPEFLETLDVELVEGENVPTGPRPEGYDPILVNESAVKAFGWTDPIGKTFIEPGRRPRVVGVIPDFNFMSLRQQVGPLVLSGSRASEYVYVRIRPDNIPGTLAFLQEQWETFGPGTEMEYSFLDERFEALYQADQRLARIFGIFSTLAVFLACLGLVGLAAFTARQRSKEISIRKVLGATAAGIVVSLSRQFAWLVVGGFVVAVPVAWLLMDRWLADFAYRIDLDPLVFLGAGAAALGVAMVAVAVQAFRAANVNPADALRCE